jgi:RecA-family ATPase
MSRHDDPLFFTEHIVNGHGKPNGHANGQTNGANRADNATGTAYYGGDDFPSRKTTEWGGKLFIRQADGKWLARDGAELRRDTNGNPSIVYDLPPGSSADLDDEEEAWQGPAWEHPAEPNEELDFTTLADDPLTHREWVIPGWIPLMETTGFTGAGGEGKTLGAQMAATSVAIGKDWLGLKTVPMKAACVLCEDYPNDAYWRQNDINRKYGLRMAELAGRLLIMPRRTKKHNYLAIFEPDGTLHKTTWFYQLVKRLKAFGARLVVIDTRADVFKGNQNDENQSREFVRQVLDAIAQAIGGAVLLLYQPSRSGRDNGSYESGSVQWDSAFRSRLVLKRRKKAENDDGNGRTIERIKANFAKPSDSFNINWDDHVFVREADPAAQPGYERAAHASKADRVFLKGLDAYSENNERVSSNKSANNYAPRVFLKDASINEGCGLDDLESALHRLLRINKIITNKPYGRGVNPPMHLVRIQTDEPKI